MKTKLPAPLLGLIVISAIAVASIIYTRPPSWNDVLPPGLPPGYSIHKEPGGTYLLQLRMDKHAPFVWAGNESWEQARIQAWVDVWEQEQVQKKHK